VIGGNLLSWLESISGLGLGIVAIALFAAQPTQKEYLWIFLYRASLIVPTLFTCYQLFRAVPTTWNVLANGFSIPTVIFYLLTFLAILRIRFDGWIRLAVAVSAAGFAFAMTNQVRGDSSSLAVVLGATPIFILLGVVLPVLLVIHWRRGNAEAGILLIPAFLQSMVLYVEIAIVLISPIRALSDVALRAQAFLNNFLVGPILLNWGSITGLLNMLSLAVIIIVRSARISRQQALLEGEVAAAQQVQQVILPEKAHTVSGFIVESVYKPAQEVGGDFFQIVPDKTNNSLLIVAGDVTGKGLKAGMLVALLVGAIRSTVETTKDPLEVLEALNRRLLGQGCAQATCLALRIQEDGTALLANAGHLPPYVNGEPLPMEGALPLGMVECAAFSVTHFKLNESDRLLLISDGIAEARDAKGDVFGFDRVLELVRARTSAEQVAIAAQKFGQEDDITVLSVVRQHAVEKAVSISLPPVFSSESV
jgi:phosphoserine phosphatase RsbU/P